MLLDHVTKIAIRGSDEPDIDEVYEHVTGTMQEALSGLAAERRYPLIG